MRAMCIFLHRCASGRRHRPSECPDFLWPHPKSFRQHRQCPCVWLLHLAALDPRDLLRRDAREVLASDALLDPQPPESAAERGVVIEAALARQPTILGVELVQNGIARSLEIPELDGLS